MDKEKEFKNDFVKNEKKPPLARANDEQSIEEWEDNKLGREPNGMDPEERFQKGLSFQETPSEARSRMEADYPNPNRS